MKALWLVVLLVPGCAYAAWNKKPSFEKLQQAVRRRGAQTVARELQASGQNSDPWFDILNHVVRGETPWIALTGQLKPYTSGEVAESVNGAFSEALKTNPAAVLRFLAIDPSSIENICGIETFIDVPIKECREHLRKAKIAVQAVHDPELEKIKRACLNELVKESTEPLKASN